MSRDIKYQAWDKVNKVMRDVWSITWDFTPDKPTAIIACNPVINSEYILREGQFELRQYTGLKDKNGKEIYEGDQLGVTGNIVEFSYGCFNVNGDRPLNWLCNNYEIIGNVHENKELLK